MPRVQRKKRNSGGKHVYTCSGCGKPVKAGEEYYTWARRFGRSGMRYYQHVACGFPRPTQLSSRKTAVVDEAVGDAENQISGWAPELEYEGATAGATLEVDYSDLQAALADVAGSAREVGEEYTSGADNMPESLQYGSQAEAMRTVGEELESWADDLEGWEPSCDTSIEVPAGYTGTDEEQAALEEAWAAMVEAVQTDAMDKLQERGVPEYQG